MKWMYRGRGLLGPDAHNLLECMARDEKIVYRGTSSRRTKHCLKESVFRPSPHTLIYHSEWFQGGSFNKSPWPSPTFLVLPCPRHESLLRCSSFFLWSLFPGSTNKRPQRLGFRAVPIGLFHTGAMWIDGNPSGTSWGLGWTPSLRNPLFHPQSTPQVAMNCDRG